MEAPELFARPTMYAVRHKGHEKTYKVSRRFGHAHDDTAELCLGKCYCLFPGSKLEPLFQVDASKSDAPLLYVYAFYQLQQNIAFYRRRKMRMAASFCYYRFSSHAP